MFVANLIDSQEANKSSRKGLFGLFSSKQKKSENHPHHQIIMEMNALRIVNEDGTIDEQVDIDKIDRIALLDPYNVTFGNVESVYPNLKGVDSCNSVLIEKEGDTKRYRFEVDSYNAINHIKNQILFWKSLGIKVESDGMIIDLN